MSGNLALECCPVIIREWIDSEVLPEYANGHNTAEQITINLCVNARDRLDLENENSDFYTKTPEDPLIDSWLLTGSHDIVVTNYIQAAFDSWEQESDTQ